MAVVVVQKSPTSITTTKVEKPLTAVTGSTTTVGIVSQGPAGDSGAEILTTKGDILGRNATGPDRIPVGEDYRLLQADSSMPFGLSYGIKITQSKTAPSSPRVWDFWVVVP